MDLQVWQDKEDLKEKGAFQASMEKEALKGDRVFQVTLETEVPQGQMGILELLVVLVLQDFQD